MADNKYLDEDIENESEQEAQKSKFVFNTTAILFSVIGLLLVVISIMGTLLAVQLLKPEPKPEAVAATVAVAAEKSNQATEKDVEPAAEEQPIVKAEKPAIYYPIKPPIIVNFEARGRQRFLQVEVALMTRDKAVIEAIDLHMPMIRNSLILLIGGHLYGELQTAEGKELLRQQCLQELRRLMEKEIGKPGIEQVLFTNFVMQ